MNWVISMSEQSGFPTDFTLLSLHIVTVSTDDHSLLDHLVRHHVFCPNNLYVLSEDVHCFLYLAYISYSEIAVVGHTGISSL